MTGSELCWWENSGRELRPAEEIWGVGGAEEKKGVGSKRVR